MDRDPSEFETGSHEAHLHLHRVRRDRAQDIRRCLASEAERR